MVLDPVVMFFIAGFTISLMKVDFKLPSAIYEFLSIMLLITIGLKGGIELSKQNVGDLVGDVGLVLLMGVLIPLIAFLSYFLRVGLNVWMPLLSRHTTVPYR